MYFINTTDHELTVDLGRGNLKTAAPGCMIELPEEWETILKSRGTIGLIPDPNYSSIDSLTLRTALALDVDAEDVSIADHDGYAFVFVPEPKPKTKAKKK